MASSSNFDDESNKVDVTLDDLFSQLSILWNVKPRGCKKEFKIVTPSKSNTICLMLSGEEPVIVNADNIENVNHPNKRPSKKRQTKEQGKEQAELVENEAIVDDLKESNEVKVINENSIL
jgi:hypothetical protein